MKNYHKITLIKNSLLILLAILIINTLNIFNFYIVKKGSLNFFSLGDHIFGFVDSLLAFFATLIAWHFSSKLRKLLKYKVLIAFVLALIFFSFFTSIYFIIVRTLNGLSINLNQLTGNIVFGTSLSFIPISGLTLAYLYFRNSQALNREKQNLQSQLLTKNLEPHFLFNNLSILSSMMRKGSNEAEPFLDSLSEVYRYFLKHNESDKVHLQQELEFLSQYIHLIVNRFGHVYQVDLKVDDSSGQVIPFVLHTCIENAIKHNTASESQPLIVEITRSESLIIIKNPLRPQASSISSGKGLNNISKRYELIFGKSIKIAEKDNCFVVEIPVISE
ncbi:histidine kinase [Marivirga sp. S37H4]|uniref:Histidine kinase n=1 Tax=Marivirga aurantiaca TaxID=2802615 RepID=A0A934WYQ2_9BACT|nr:histidine kinase [Marivirga aurantiaca]MBK6265619.1 histidine kinase [Marivirga aurantiaca]